MKPHTTPEIDDLEQQLRMEADRLLTRQHVKSCASALARTHRRRRRNRTAVSCASVALLFGAGAILWSHYSGDTSHKNDQRPMASGRHVDDGEANVANRGADNNDATPGMNLPPPPSVLPVVLSLTDGSEVLATGYYVPEQVEQVQFDNLTSAEQRAVIRLIGSTEQSQFGPY